MKLVLPSDYPHTAPKGMPRVASSTSLVFACDATSILAKNAEWANLLLQDSQTSTDKERSKQTGFFLTKIFHPNIRQPSGEICVNTLKKDWQPSHGIRHVLMVIRCLLIEPFPESALNEEAAKLMLEDYDEYFRRAKMFTGIHAKPCRSLLPGEAASAEGTGSAAENPATKKAKSEKKMDKKKSLRRL